MGLAGDIRSAVPLDLAKQLGRDGVRNLLRLLSDAYRDLYARRCVQVNSPEDWITEEWFVCIQARWKREPDVGLIPVIQKQDRRMAAPRGHPPTIDFCFRDTLVREAYFGAECKLLDEGCREHLKAYLDDEQGIGRFLTARYGASTSAGAMVGYVRRGQSPGVGGTLADAIRQLRGTPRLRKSAPLPHFDQVYESTHHRRRGVSPFLCFHLLFAFHCVAA